MKSFYYLLSVCLVISCNKNNSISSTSDWHVKYEVVSGSTNPQVYIQWSNGVNTYFTGPTSDNTVWPYTPWTKDTVFKAEDGDRIIGLNVVYILGPSVNEQDIISRIYVNGVKEKEGKGMNQFLKTGLK